MHRWWPQIISIAHITEPIMSSIFVYALETCQFAITGQKWNCRRLFFVLFSLVCHAPWRCRLLIIWTFENKVGHTYAVAKLKKYFPRDVEIIENENLGAWKIFLNDLKDHTLICRLKLLFNFPRYKLDRLHLRYSEKFSELFLS